MTRSAALRAAVLAVCSAIAYTQQPLYSSNQNTYFLHGLAQSGVGYLAQDWLAHTADPVPVFSALVHVTNRWLAPPAFYLYTCALFGVYMLGLLGVASTALGIRSSSRTGWILATALVALHSGLLEIGSERVFGANLPRLFERGLADQYLVGPMLQPSGFGVLLLAGIVAAARQRHALAVVCVALATAFHPTYLSIAGVFVLTMVAVQFHAGRGRDAVKTGLLAVVLLAPIVVHVVTNFQPGSADVHAEAMRILVKLRLPHHADITQWFGAGAVFQILLMVGGLLLARGTPVFPFLWWPFLAGAALTVVQVASGSPSLALLFPWRFSVVLVPVSTTLILGRLLLWLRGRVPRGWLAHTRLADAGVAAALALLTASGLVGTVMRFRSAVSPESRALMDFVRAEGRQGDLCLIPTTMESFRIGTGIPVFVDLKNHPVRDVEVMEWYRRILWTREVRAAGADSVSHVVRDLLGHYPITIVVAEPPDSALAQCDVLTHWHDVGGFTLYRVNEGPGPRDPPGQP